MIPGDTVIGKQKYTVINTIGNGSFGTVYYVKTEDNQKYAIKEIHLSDILEPLNELEWEINILKYLSTKEGMGSDHVVKFYEFIKTDDFWYIIMEFGGMSNLTDIVDDNLDISSILSQSAKGLYFLHKNGIVHRDIKPQNILVGEFGLVKIADLGLGCGVFEIKGIPECKSILHGGTLEYIDPLFLSKKIKHAIPASDIYALGLTVYFLLYPEEKIPPMKNEKYLQVMAEKINTAPISNELKDIMIQMLNPYSADDRPTALDIIEYLEGKQENRGINAVEYLEGKQENKGLDIVELLVNNTKESLEEELALDFIDEITRNDIETTINININILNKKLNITKEEKEKAIQELFSYYKV